MWSEVRTSIQPRRTQTVFNKALFWFSLSGIVLISASSIWTYYNTNQLIEITRERREVALGKGLALSISDSIVTREYALIEGDLRQIMSNEDVKSLVVTDMDGSVLGYLERENTSGVVVPNFNVNSINIPRDIASQYLLERQGNTSILWYEVNPGVPLGWIRIESLLRKNDGILDALRLNILLSVVIFFLGLFGIALTLFFRVKQKNQEEEVRLANANVMLHEVAYHDVLTKLPNRLALHGLLESSIATTKINSDLLAICFLDLDGFKNVNDRMGHQSGDDLLIAAAGRMKKAIRERDSVIRLGGDEFVLILGGINNKTQLEFLMNRILGLLSDPFMINGGEVCISASCGVTIYPSDNSSNADLLLHADEAMYEAKAKGRNTWEIYTQDKPLL